MNNKALIDNIKIIADEKRIPRDTVAFSLKEAIEKAYKKEFPDTEIEINVDIDRSILEVNRLLKVVENYDDLNDYTEISIEDAKKNRPDVVLGEIYRDPIDLAKLDRTLAVHVLQGFKHNISTSSNSQIYKE
jgi:N utilization substance protein A